MATDHALVAEFLERTAHLSQTEVEERVAGVTQSDVSRWRRGKFQRLTAAKRRAIKRWLDRAELRPDAIEAERQSLLAAAEALEDQARVLRERAHRIGMDQVH